MPVLDTIERTIERTTTFDAPSPLLFCTPADPFEIDHDCLNPRGHIFVRDCADVVCVFCGRVAWG